MASWEELDLVLHFLHPQPSLASGGYGGELGLCRNRKTSEVWVRENVASDLRQVPRGHWVFQGKSSPGLWVLSLESRGLWLETQLSVTR